jgi:hypothetical protein
MPMNDAPKPAFERFEQVVVVSKPQHLQEFAGETGTVIWRDFLAMRQSSGRESRWIYVVDFDARKQYATCPESELQSTGEMGSEEDCLGKRCEISFDVVIENDNSFVEGSYRLPGRCWEVLIMSKKDVPELRYRPSTWSSGITGLIVDVPKSIAIDQAFVINTMASVFGEKAWAVVKGPDSIVLR